MDQTELPTYSVTDDDLTRIKEIFDEIDEDNNGYIKSENVRTCVQLFGQNPSDMEIDKALERIQITSPGQLTSEELKSVIEATSKPKQVIEDEISESLSTILESLKSSDGEVFSKEELKLFLQERGDEPLLQEEIDDLFNDLDPDGRTDTLTKTQLIELLNTEF